MTGKTYDIKDRALEFAVRVCKFVDKLSRGIASQEYGKQFIKSSASIGANMEEADCAVSKRDFVNKVGIARKEARETRYWLRLIKKAELVKNPGDLEELEWLLKEAEEILLIVSSIMKKARTKQ